MINIKELRHGNLLKKDGIIHHIISVNGSLDSESVFTTLRTNVSMQESIFIGMFKPITLTEEILTSCGFELYDYEDDENEDIMKYYRFNYSEERFYYVGIMPDGFNEFGIETGFTNVMLNGNVHSLHQLQNIYFDLTGKELEIKF